MNQLPKKVNAVDSARVRPCLVCRVDFASEGFGDRVCRRCKSTKTWKSGRLDSPQHGSRRR